MVVGIPNVGKSTFINTFAGRACAKTGNKPGVTKGKQWIRLNKNCLLYTSQVLAGQIEDILAQRGGKILESYQLFDIYEGSQIKGGYKSMAYALVFRDHDKTCLLYTSRCV